MVSWESARAGRWWNVLLGLIARDAGEDLEHRSLCPSIPSLKTIGAPTPRSHRLTMTTSALASGLRILVPAVTPIPLAGDALAALLKVAIEVCTIVEVSEPFVDRRERGL